MDLKARLAGARKAWKAAEVRKRIFEALPEGEYQWVIATAVRKEDSDGVERVRLTLKVEAAADDSLLGRTTSKSYNLFDKEGVPNEIGMSVLKTDLATLGIEPEFDTLNESLEGLVGAVCQGVVRIKDDKNGIPRENVYINSLKVASAPSTGAVKKGRRF